ncbi:efflux RND transporter periplasmic adaptor subunit [Mariniblastus fucicola]|uniref:Macrolide transporter subunit MacA n=1 Tax=Mariniblastus fucicola TaxID=980251 RepID=A0A5B9P7H2_9BACT|nr:efflux RND transporter periplasmic adaptor subunit [Mariniblastus fucicola]QEG20900.1 macrolide transporter subunit MacA [Mariniblastus fucicola]
MSESIQTSPTPATAPTVAQDREFEIQIETNPIGLELRELVAKSGQLTDIIRGVAEVVCRETECLALWISQREPQSGELRTHPLTDENTSSVAEVAGEKLPHLISTTIETGILGTVQISENHSIVASSVGLTPERCDMVFTGCFVHTSGTTRHQQWMMKIGSQTIEQWIRQSELGRSQKQAKFVGDALSLCGMLDRSTSKREAANYLVNHLRRLLGVSQVVCCDGKTPERSRLLAISEVEQFDPHSESSRVILSAGSTGIGAAEPIVFSPNSNGTTDASNIANVSNANAVQTLVLEAYCKANRFASCVSVPMQDHEGNATGSILVASNEDSFSELQLTQLQQFAAINGAHLDVVRRANLKGSELVAERIKRIPSKNWFRFGWKAAAALALLMCIPIPYRVACDCEIQPVTRRFVSAPYTGPLERSVVRPGEVVSKDQVLAYMDGRQLQLELTGVEAEHQAARRRHSSALAQGEVAQSQIARSEMRKLETRIKSLNDQLSRLEIRSPYDGIVISGDLDKAQGATMEIGQTLFEVAPLDDMLAEVAIPESEIQYVSGTNSVAIKLNAFPYRTFYGEVNTINPSAEMLNDESVFVADVKLVDDESVIRPGMKGSAKIKTSWRPIGWNLFHNAWESVRCWTIW